MRLKNNGLFSIQFDADCCKKFKLIGLLVFDQRLFWVKDFGFHAMLNHWFYLIKRKVSSIYVVEAFCNCSHGNVCKRGKDSTERQNGSVILKFCSKKTVCSSLFGAT